MNLINNHLFKSPSTIAFGSRPASPIDNKALKFQNWTVKSKVLERSAKYQHQLDNFIASAFNNSKPKTEKKEMMASTISTANMTLKKTSACFLSSPRQTKTVSRSKLNERRPFVGYYDPCLNSVKPRNMIHEIRSPPSLSPFRTPAYIQVKDTFSPDSSFLDSSTIHNGTTIEDKEKEIKLVRAPDFSKQLARFMINK